MRSKQGMPKWMRELVLMVFLIFGALMGQGMALSPEVPIQVEGDRLTGHLSQVTLRSVLEQLQKQLGIKYEAPGEELNRVISVDLQQDKILPALAKILAQWDYAFTVNAAGRLQYLYVTAKAPPKEAVSETRNPTDVDSSDVLGVSGLSSDRQMDPGQEEMDTRSFLSQEGETGDNFSPASSSFSSSGESSGLRAPVVGVPMDIQPVPAGTTMPMVPPSSASGMQVTPPANSPDMPIIPATAYPPMEIEPVPSYLQEEMLRNMQP
ncbi:hypothetical protein [Candidatus Nitrospira allomarina]|jgi:hypothetical protein|uniref:Uncharacterized protein n=1 Tax=Candidatus Nitrospira allomarina TaxID=3020900 RepID=A0AA96JTT5_9BACT|nr:hypothetical protein [Candidatus Nitrospira allomarina]WNM59877.1 hypothetical protein PP769_09010 [Candidatus Nitrospira allomarina]